MEVGIVLMAITAGVMYLFGGSMGGFVGVACGVLLLIFAIATFMTYQSSQRIKEYSKLQRLKARQESERLKDLSPEVRGAMMMATAAVERAANEASTNSHIFGNLSDKLVCPHCQSKGTVRSKSDVRIDKARVNSVAGKAIGLGTNTERKVTQLHCDNCSMTWDI